MKAARPLSEDSQMRSDAASLRAAGRTPALPLQLVLADGSLLSLHRLLRVLPGKRIVTVGEYQGREVLAKLFIARASQRHCAREQAGIEALHKAGLPTPTLLHSASLAGGDGRVLLSEFIPNALSLATFADQFVRRPAGDAELLAIVSNASVLIGRLHANGLVHDDLHLGNFLCRDAAGCSQDGSLLLIDGDAVRRLRRQAPLEAADALANFAAFAAQLPPAWDRFAADLLASWQAADPALPVLEVASLQQHIDRLRAARLADYLAKSGRDCSLFKAERHSDRHSLVVRHYAEPLAALIAAPDVALARGERLKDGNTCTVAKVQVGELTVVVKRYNIKSPAHALSRAWRPSRASHAWRAAHRLQLLAIPTPMPLALIEQRLGPLRRRAWLVTAWQGGEDLLAHLKPHVDTGLPAPTAHALRTLFASLQRYRISHGDLKANNLLWDGEQLLLIDLDAMQQHRSRSAYARAWRRDRARLLRNWPADSALGRELAQLLPAVPV